MVPGKGASASEYPRQLSWLSSSLASARIWASSEIWITLPNGFSINSSRRFFSMGFKNIRNLLPAFQRRNSNTNYLAVNKIKSQAAR